MAASSTSLHPTTLLSVNYIHNSLIRTIEDVGQLIDGSEVYVYGNPGEGIVTARIHFNC